MTQPLLAAQNVDNRPYFSKLSVDPNDVESVFNAASTILCYPNSASTELSSNLSISKISGGVTNTIFRVSGYPSPYPNSVLLRIFGGEGLIDRDKETSTYASLCDAGIGYKYFGRFANGRLEGWLEGYRTLSFRELGDNIIGVACKLAKLHATYQCGSNQEVVLWNQLFEWLDQASTSVSNGTFVDERDYEKAKHLMQEYDILNELNQMKADTFLTNARSSFCHNDLCHGNIMVNEVGDLQMIDFEYGGYNYIAFDIANHFNEYAGGNDDGKPDYTFYPSRAKQEEFIDAYLKAYSKFGGDESIFKNLLAEVDAFAVVNNLYWGLWGVNQALLEGCKEFDYLLYAENRLKRFRDCQR